MNERVEMAQDKDAGEDREGAWLARPSLAGAGFRNNSEGRADCDLRDM